LLLLCVALMLGCVALTLFLYQTVVRKAFKTVRSTAESVATLRFLGTLETDLLAVCNDTLAQHFVMDLVSIFAVAPLIHKMMTWQLERSMPGGYGMVLARTRLWDEKMQLYLKKNHTMGQKGVRIRQIVILGAGYDTRAYRFEELLRERQVTVFEVDKPDIQNGKRKKLASVIKGGLPDYVKYVSSDFNLGTLGKDLKKAGFDQKEQTLFLWEGVTSYLKAEVVDATMAWMKANSPTGSVIFFDFKRAAAYRDPAAHHGMKQAMAFVAKLGEAYEGFSIESGLLDEWLAERGWLLTLHITPKELEQYVWKSTGTPLCKVAGYQDFVIATNTDSNEK